MPGAPGSSLACAECRRRRKKCDLKRPHCTRCQKSNILCSGPGNDRTFVHTRVDGGKLRKQRQTLVDNIRENKTYNGNTTELLHIIKQQNGLFHRAMSNNAGYSMLAPNFVLPNEPFEPVFLTLLDEFKEGKQTGIFTADRAPLTVGGKQQAYSPIALSIRALIRFASPARNTLNVAIFALLVLYLGRLKGNNEMLAMSRRAYGIVLDKTRAVLSTLPDSERNSERHWTLMVCQIVALRLFELLDNIEPAHPGVMVHESAIVAIMKTLGPKAFTSNEMKRLLQGLRTFAVNNAIIERHDTIFTQAEWIELLKIKSEWCPRQSLMDIASKIPNIIARADGVPFRSYERNRGYNYYQEAHMLLDQMNTIHQELEAWLARYESMFIGPLFWSANDSSFAVNHHGDAECQPKHISKNSQLRFHSAPVAGILAAYASFRLELWMLADKLRGKMALLNTDEEKALSKNRDQLSRQESNAARKTAWLILEAMPYLSSCFEGNVVLQAPLRIIEEYYRNEDLVLQTDAPISFA